MNRKKILHIQLLPLLSGVQNMMLSLLAGLDRAEYDIYVLSKPGGPLTEAVKQAGYHYIPLSSLRRDISFYDIVAFFELVKIIKKHGFDIVHTHSSKTGVLGRIAARLAGCRKVIHTVHGFAMHEYQNTMVNKLYSSMEFIAGLFCDKVIFVNDFEREAAIGKKLLSPGKVLTIYNGIPVKSFRCKNPQDYLKERDYAKLPFTIGSVLRFTEQKNTLNTIKAAIKVCQINKDIRFVFIGDGEEFLQCKDMVEKAKLNSRILLPGWQTEINELLLKMDVFLLYSLWEGLSISILEAMASGLPIVASAIKGNNELVSKQNGILVKVNNEENLVRELNRLPDAREQLLEWSRNSRILAEEKFGIDRFVKQYKEVYHDK